MATPDLIGKSGSTILTGRHLRLMRHMRSINRLRVGLAFSLFSAIARFDAALRDSCFRSGTGEVNDVIFAELRYQNQKHFHGGLPGLTILDRGSANALSDYPEKSPIPLPEGQLRNHNNH